MVSSTMKSLLPNEKPRKRQIVSDMLPQYEILGFSKAEFIEIPVSIPKE